MVALCFALPLEATDIDAARSKALFDSVAQGNLARSRSLLEHGADVNARTESGDTPLMSAAVTAGADMMKLLLAHGADPNAKKDGGWAQLATLESDAYATGQALFALATAGNLAVTDPTFLRGVQFLLKTQLEDASWFVQSRSVPVQPYFESGFPHGRSQYISYAATAWAAMALMLTEKERQ
jgi:Ankyrin repeats (many copies)